jgi:hypothetical protein
LICQYTKPKVDTNGAEQAKPIPPKLKHCAKLGPYMPQDTKPKNDKTLE